MEHRGSPWHLRGDLHVHASHSRCDRHKAGDPVDYNHDCGAEARREMQALAASPGFEYLAIVNHATDPIAPERATPASQSKLAQHLAEVEAVKPRRIEIRVG